MTKVRLGNLCLAAAVAGVILCAVLMRAFYMPYSGFWRTVLYNILILFRGRYRSGGVSCTHRPAAACWVLPP